MNGHPPPAVPDDDANGDYRYIPGEPPAILGGTVRVNPSTTATTTTTTTTTMVPCVGSAGQSLPCDRMGFQSTGGSAIYQRSQAAEADLFLLSSRLLPSGDSVRLSRGACVCGSRQVSYPTSNNDAFGEIMSNLENQKAPLNSNL